MKRSSAHSWVAIALSIFVCTSLVRAAAPRGTDPANQDLKRVLTGEAEHASTSLNRRNELQPALHPKTASDAEWWQAGFVKVGNAWLHAETAHQQLNTSLLQAYHAQREAAAKTAEGQMKLAHWCQEHKLGDQERAHLLQVIVLSKSETERIPAFRRMGYRKFGQNWVSPAEIQELHAKLKHDEEHRLEWKQVFERIVRNWNANPKQHKQAQEELKTVEKPSAIPALLMASTIDESLALAVCQQLEKMPSFESSQALTAIAVQSDWSSVRKAATKCLKERKVDDFAPALLGAMRTMYSMNGESSSTTPRLIFREEADRYVSVDLRFFTQRGGVVGGSNRLMTAALIRNRARIENERFAGDVDHAMQVLLDEENDRTEIYNERAAAILAEVTGQEPSNDPRYWWGWWYLHTGTEQAPKHCVAEIQRVALPVAIPQRASSCLIAGTPIVTDRGPVAVEQIQAGDRVLSKNAETGELDLRPVIHTTARDPVRVLKVTVGMTTFVASEGHHFWVSGKGWTKTRELKPGDPIHTAVGMLSVTSIETEAEPAPVYNLIVADSHSYFVGQDMILSHDVLQPTPTNAKVPGLDPQ